jgi:NADPH:quinone reductase-like Zn-dependent oxidoreductase
MTSHRAHRIHDYGGPEVAWFDDLPTPEPAPGQVLVRVTAAGVNQLDWKIREGYLRDNFPLALPVTLGVDFAGTVTALGEDVVDFAPGDRVCGFLPQLGAHTEALLVDAALLARTPDTLGDIDAAAIPVTSLTAWQALNAAGHLEATHRVLIHAGAGAVGGWAVQFARAAGAEVIATARGQNHGYVKELGADEVIDHRAEAFEDRGDSADLVLDLVGGSTLERSWSVVKPGGAIVSVAQPDIAASAPAGKRGIWLETRPDPELLQHIAADVADGASRCRVARKHPFDEINQAIEANRAGEHGPGKIVVDFTR